MIVSTIWLGALGFTDDYIKIFKKDKKGLKGKYKILALAKSYYKKASYEDYDQIVFYVKGLKK